jgi:hypothetical protein
MRTIFVALFSMLTFYANAQLNKGNWLIGGSGRFLSSDIKDVSSNGTFTKKYTIFGLSPNIGYFFADNFAVGISPSLLLEKVTYQHSTPPGGSNIEKIQLYTFGVFSRYYFLKKEKPTNILLQTSYQLGTEKFNDNAKTTLSNFTIAAGPAIFFNNIVAAEILLGYVYNKRNNKGSIPENFKKNTLQISIGLQIHLTKDKD